MKLSFNPYVDCPKCGESEPSLGFKRGIDMDGGFLDCGYRQRGADVEQHRGGHLHLKCSRCGYTDVEWFMRTKDDPPPYEDIPF